MNTILSRHALACCLLGVATGCAHESPTLDVTTSTAAMQAPDVRILARKVNLMEPIVVASEGEDVTITYASRGRHGTTVRIDPTTLSAVAVTPYEYAPHEKRRIAPCLEEASSTSGGALDVVGCERGVTTSDGRTVVAFVVSDDDGIALAVAAR